MKIKSLLLTLVLSSLSTTNPVRINSKTIPKSTYQTITAGTVDANFGGKNGAPAGSYNPSIVLDNDDDIMTMQLQTDGKILIAGAATIDGEVQWYVQRLNVNGTLDTSFNAGSVDGTPGSYNPDLGGASGIYTMQLQTDGKILLFGYATIEADLKWYARRLLNDINPLTQLKSSYGNTGFITSA
ncbi:MAG: hypothetical protein ACJAZS_000261 [Alteromonas naphthalenivorans]|jgi:hypothetical protein